MDKITRYEGHAVIVTNGYYDVYYPEHPNARKNGSIMLQVLVAEKILGRYLKKGEVVHHKDFNRLNNDMDNLMVFASNSDHRSFHAMIKSKNKKDFIFYKKENIYYCSSIFLVESQGSKEKLCPICKSNLIYYRSSMCKNCRKIKNRKVERPLRIVLKSKIRNLPFVQIGIEYGVSDNAIKKWCKSYKLPFKKCEIKKYSNEEWEKV